MAEFSDAADAALNGIAASGGLVEEYQQDDIRVRRGAVEGQVKAAAMLAGLASRRSRGLLRVVKIQEPSE